MKKQFFEVDTDGLLTGETIVINIEGNEQSEETNVPHNYFEGWGNRKIFNAKWDFELGDWVESKPLSEILNHVKSRKDEELNKDCKESILKGFTHTIEGVEYFFSFDPEAQSNFQGVERLFDKGLVTEVTWTVRKSEEYKRIIITKEVMDELTIKILQHKNGNISKYRDYLLPLVHQATTVEEVEGISWDSV
jgi:hypothetical protein